MGTPQVSGLVQGGEPSTRTTIRAALGAGVLAWVVDLRRFWGALPLRTYRVRTLSCASGCGVARSILSLRGLAPRVRHVGQAFAGVCCFGPVAGSAGVRVGESVVGMLHDDGCLSGPPPAPPVFGSVNLPAAGGFGVAGWVPFRAFVAPVLAAFVWRVFSQEHC